MFSSIACLWVACHGRRLLLLALAVAALTAGFLAKALTAYVFYGIAVLVLAWDRDARRFLLSPASIVIHAAGAAALAIWFGVLPASKGRGPNVPGDPGQADAGGRHRAYLIKLIRYALETLIRTAPAALIAGYYLWRHRGKPAAGSGAFNTAALIALLSYAPYWLAPQSHARYLMPIYPMLAIVFAHWIWRARPASIAVTVKWFYAFLAIKLVFVLALFPYYQRIYRGENYEQLAHTILNRTAGHPLYAVNVSASGLSVKAYIDLARLPQQPLAFPPPSWESGFVIAYEPDPKLGEVAAQYRLGGNALYLLCRGAACAAQPATGLVK